MPRIRPTGRAAPRAGLRGRGRLPVASLAVLLAIGLAAPAARAAAPPVLSARNAALIDASTGQHLYSLNGYEEVPIASTTKIMTALVTLEHVRHLGTVFTQNDWRAASGDSQIGLAPGDRMTAHDLLLAMLLPSADDAAEDLAFNVGGGSIPRFVAMMNAASQRLGLTHTHYSTPIGLDTPGNYSSAFDLDKLAAYVLAHSRLFRRIVSLPRATLRSGPMHDVVNRNDLLGRVPWINGVKTGHTYGAGYALVASGTRDGMTLIGTVLGTGSAAARDQSAVRLLDYGFAEFRMVRPIAAGQVVATRAVSNLSGTRAVLIATTGFERVIRRSARVTLRVALKKPLAGPLAQGALVGHMAVRIDSRPVARLPLVLARALPAPPPSSGLLGGYRPLLLLAPLMLAALALLRRNGRLRLTRRNRLEAR
jgi:D-alanyl-D-alanine carboxypeptidase (penicillin-binding protein 5/6)